MLKIKIRAAAVASVAALAATAVQAQEHVFKFHHFVPEHSASQTEMIEPWARRVEENSGGRVRIDIYPRMALGGRPPELASQVREGVVDLVWTVNGYTPGVYQMSEVAELPYLQPFSLRAANLALYDLFQTDLKDEYVDVEVMWIHVHGGQGLHMRDAPVRDLDDLAGRHIRIPSRTGAWMIEALGAIPVGMPIPELPLALDRGVVDGAFISWHIIPELSLQDHTEHQIEGHDGARFGTIVFQVSMNKERWESLPPDIQQAFRDASDRDWWGEVGDIWAVTDAAGLDVATDAGNEHFYLSEEETAVFRDALEPVIDRWIADVAESGIDGASLVERYLELAESYDEAE